MGALATIQRVLQQASAVGLSDEPLNRDSGNAVFDWPNQIETGTI